MAMRSSRQRSSAVARLAGVAAMSRKMRFRLWVPSSSSGKVQRAIPCGVSLLAWDTLSPQGFVEGHQVVQERGLFVNHCTGEAARNNAKPPSAGSRRWSPLVLQTLVEAWMFRF